MKIPNVYKRVWKMAFSGKSRTAAIKAHCLMCVGWQRKEVTNCTASETCPLYPYRPYQDKKSLKKKTRKKKAKK